MLSASWVANRKDHFLLRYTREQHAATHLTHEELNSILCLRHRNELNSNLNPPAGHRNPTQKRHKFEFKSTLNLKFYHNPLYNAMLKLRASNCWLQEKLTLTARPSGAEHSALTTQLVLELQGCYHDPPTRRVDNFTKGFMVSSGYEHMYEHYLLLGFQT